MEDLNGVSKKWPSGVKNKQILTVTREKVAKFLNVSNKSHHLIETLRMLGQKKSVTSTDGNTCNCRIDFVFILDELIDPVLFKNNS